MLQFPERLEQQTQGSKSQWDLIGRVSSQKSARRVEVVRYLKYPLVGFCCCLFVCLFSPRKARAGIIRALSYHVREGGDP